MVFAFWAYASAILRLLTFRLCSLRILLGMPILSCSPNKSNIKSSQTEAQIFNRFWYETLLQLCLRSEDTSQFSFSVVLYTFPHRLLLCTVTAVNRNLITQCVWHEILSKFKTCVRNTCFIHEMGLILFTK